MCEVCPLFCVFHYLTSTSGIVFIYRYFCADIFFGYSKSFFDTKLNRQTMRVPSGFTLHMKSTHRFISAYDILYCTCHHMMDSGHSVSGRWTLEKHECRTPFPLFHTVLEQRMIVPLLQHLFIDVRKIELLTVFFEILCHLLVANLSLKFV